MKYVSSVTLASALALTIGFAGPAAAAEAYLTGTISAANGDKLAGVSVSAKPIRR
jgi:hypothetical protein